MDLSWPLERAARLYGDSVAVVDGPRSVTYAELARRVAALGGALGELVEPGGRIGVLAANSLAHMECFLGIPAAGRVVVSVNHRLAGEELAFMVRDAGIDVLITDREVDLPVRDVIAVGDGYEALVSGEPVRFAEQDEDALAAISYTGGTTGTPKGVMLSHGNLLANARHNMIAVGHAHADRWLHFCPMFHVAGTANVVAATWAGARHVVLPRFDPEAVARAIEREAITHVVFVPTMLAAFLDHGAGDLSSLRHMQYAASPIAPELQRRVLDAFSCDVAQMYGMTEAAPTVTELTPADHRSGERLGSMGVPVAGVRAEIRGDDAREVAPGEVGEVWVRGPNVMLGYWNRPEATAQALVDGWYRSGDAAYADEQGYLHMVDRLKDMIITGGENVYSVEVEAVLAEHPAVAEAAVFGVPDARWGEAVHAVVSVREAVAAGELADHCRRHVAGFKVPRAIEVTREALPKSGAGKLLKHKLREPYWEGYDRRVG